jgi:hypothetical protein
MLVSNAKELADTYDAIQGQMKTLPSPDKIASSPAKSDSVVSDIYLSRLGTVH